MVFQPIWVSSDLDNMSNDWSARPSLSNRVWNGLPLERHRQFHPPLQKPFRAQKTAWYSIHLFLKSPSRTTKGGDPLIVHDSIVALGMMDADTLKELVALNAKAMGLIHDLFKQKGLDLWDIKIEWGKDAETGKLMLIDEVAPTGCRAND